MTEFDKDTSKELNEGIEISEGIKGRFWAIAKKDLLDRLTEMNTITLIDGLAEKTDEEIGKETKLRANTVKIVFDWINNIEGRANQYEYTKPLVERPEDKLITNYENS